MNGRIACVIAVLAIALAVVAQNVAKEEFAPTPGSGLKIESLTPTQANDLARLARVWGYLKYHHPKVASGSLDWDRELLSELPKVLRSGNRAIREWLVAIGPAPQCNPCATLDESRIQARPRLDWLKGDAALEQILRNRSEKQFYVDLQPLVGNPIFTHEPRYATLAFPDAGYQLLALFRFWNVIEYWFPSRDVMGENWNAVLRAFIPRMALAKTREAYQLALLELIGKIHDSHANLSNGNQVRPPRGKCTLPGSFRFLGEQLVVTEARQPLERGDVIESIASQPVAKLVSEWLPYYPASNRRSALRDMAARAGMGPCGPVALNVRRGGASVKLAASREPAAAASPARAPEFQRLSPSVAYLNLAMAKMENVASYIADAEGSKGLIIDIRNYPAAFVVFALGGLLADKPTPFARFTMGDLANPGAFHWSDPAVITPQTPHYAGKVVVLVDESSISQAEYTAMAFRAMPGAIVLGSPTTGADGNVSEIPLPGGMSTRISGIGVFDPDKRPTQRVGIIPDIDVKATVEGIRAGRDEVLERAIRYIEELKP